MMTVGFLYSVLLHGSFNFIVTLPNILPNRPQTFADLLGANYGFLQHIHILLLPSIFYVVGGFWLISTLLTKTNAAKERGRLVHVDAMVREQMA